MRFLFYHHFFLFFPFVYCYLLCNHVISSPLTHPHMLTRSLGTTSSTDPFTCASWYALPTHSPTRPLHPSSSSLYSLIASSLLSYHTNLMLPTPPHPQPPRPLRLPRCHRLHPLRRRPLHPHRHRLPPVPGRQLRPPRVRPLPPLPQWKIFFPGVGGLRLVCVLTGRAVAVSVGWHRWHR